MIIHIDKSNTQLISAAVIFAINHI